jgi:hypothetical protein
MLSLIQKLIQHRLLKPMEYQPSSHQYNPLNLFEFRKDILEHAAKSTCYVGSEYLEGDEPASSTAFFLGPSTLLTAGHAAQEPGVDVVAQYPGIREAEYFVEKLFKLDHHGDKIHCRCTATLWPGIDISILDCSPYHAQTWVVPKQIQFEAGERVDVIGYPGLYSERNVQENRRHIKVDSTAIKEVTDILPKCHLIISNGNIVSHAAATYRVSTAGGMSGSPVLVKRTCVGTQFLKMVLNCQGVHIRAVDGRANRCVTFGRPPRIISKNRARAKRILFHVDIEGKNRKKRYGRRLHTMLSIYMFLLKLYDQFGKIFGTLFANRCVL